MLKTVQGRCVLVRMAKDKAFDAASLEFTSKLNENLEEGPEGRMG